MTMRTIRLFRAAALSFLALTASCGSSDTDTGGETKDGPCDAADADKLDPIECNLGVCNVLVAACQAGQPASCPPLEPDLEDSCGDGLDNNCNGLIDDGCDCKDGEAKPCYSGSLSTRNKGECHDGVQLCKEGTWLECNGDVRPAKELCDGLDDDCDGAIDEGCDCKDGAQQECYGGAKATAGVGLCVRGAQTCSGGAWGQCVGSVLPQDEACDALDNDCDGEVDEGDFGQGEACEVGGAEGPCKAGMSACGPSGLQCLSAVMPAAESCDGVDNDCNGVIDNGDFCCVNGVKGGPESDVDCGATCDVKCDDSKACHTPDDCKSAVCTDGVCGN